MNGILSMSLGDFYRALIITVIVAIGTYILGVGDVWALNWHVLINNAVIAGISSIIVSLGTTKQGNFVGAIPVK